MNDRNGNPIVVGADYVVVGEALSEFSADKIALDTKRAVLVDNTVSGAAPTVAQVSTDLLPLSSLASASHAHSAADITSGTIATARLGSGTADNTTFLRGDSTWAVVAGGSHDPVTVVDTTSINLTLTGQQVQADAIFGTTSGTVAEGNHTHAQLHDAVTVADSSSIDLTLTGQQISAAAIFGTTAGTVCQGNDSRLSDTRDPKPHEHPIADVTDLQAELDGKAAASHTHAAGDIASGTIAAARLPQFTGGDVTTASAGSVNLQIAAGAVGTTELGGDITTAGKALLDDADNTAQRATLGLGTAATRNMGFGAADLVDVGTLVATFASLTHTHNGTDAPLLAQAVTHQSPDTDSATTALHHTLGTGANQAAAGNHTAHAELDLAKVSTPSTPADGVTLFGQARASRPFLVSVDEAGAVRPMQHALFGMRQPVIVTLQSGTTAPVVFGATLTTATTMSFQHSAVSNNRWTSTPRKRYATSSASTTTGCRQAYTQFYRGSATGYGGVFFAARFGVATNKAAALFVGLCASTSALSGNPTALVNCIGMGYDVGDSTGGNWFLIRNDGSGTAALGVGKIDLGATNAARAANIGFDLFIYNPPNSGTFYVQIINVATGVEVLNTSYATEVPAADTGLCWKCEVRNDANATQCDIEHNHIYVEPLS